MEFLQSFLRRRFAGKPMVASGIVDHFLRVLPSRQLMFLHLYVTFLTAAIFTPACIFPLLYCPIWKRRTTPSLERCGFCLVMDCCLNLTGGKAIQCGIWSSSRKIVSQLETSIHLIVCLIWLRYAMSKKYKVQYTKHTSLMLMVFVRKSKLLIKHSQKLISNMLILQDRRGNALVSPVSHFTPRRLCGRALSQPNLKNEGDCLQSRPIEDVENEIQVSKLDTLGWLNLRGILNTVD